MKIEINEINIPLYLVLCFFTFGLFYFFWQYHQMSQINILLKSKRHSFFLWFLLSFITLGIYHIYHEYQASKDIIEIQKRYYAETSSKEFPILCLIISIFGMFFFSDMIHQDEINKIIRKINSNPNLLQD